jgi:hypothetical protein
MAIFKMTATWVGGGYLGGTAEAVFSLGQGWAQAGWCYAASLIVGGMFFAKKLRDNNHTTMLDPFEQRFGKDGAALLYIPALLGEIFWTAAIMVVLGASFAAILGESLVAGILITAVVTIGYTVMSGLWAVAYTDVVQLSMVIVFLLIVVFIGVPKVGGWNTMWGNYNEAFGTPGAGVIAFLMVIPPSILAVIGFNYDWAVIGVAHTALCAAVCDALGYRCARSRRGVSGGDVECRLLGALRFVHVHLENIQNPDETGCNGQAVEVSSANHHRYNRGHCHSPCIDFEKHIHTLVLLLRPRLHHAVPVPRRGTVLQEGEQDLRVRGNNRGHIPALHGGYSRVRVQSHIQVLDIRRWIGCRTVSIQNHGHGCRDDHHIRCVQCNPEDHAGAAVEED